MKNFKKYTAVLLTAVLSFFLYSCEDESQNFDIEAANELVITTENTSYNVIQFENLKITPEISHSIEDGRTYSYEWSAVPTNGGTTDEIVSLSKTKDLNIPISLKVNNYSLVFTVSDDKTGVAYSERYAMRVNSGFYEGWLVANNSNGKGKLSFIRIDGLVIDNPIEQINGKSYPGVAMDAASPIAEFSELQQIYYFTSQGVYLFDSDSFAELGDANSVFSQPITANGRANVSVGGYDYSVNVVNSGKIHTTSLFSGFDGSYSPSLIGNYQSVFPYQFVSSNGRTYFHDNITKRFVYLGFGSTDVLLAANTPSNVFFNMANTKSTMIAAAHGTGTIYYALMKDDASGTYQMCRLTNGVPTGKKELSVEGLEKVKGFDALSQGASLIYFAVENKLYRYDFAANTAEVIYTFDSGSKVSDIKVYKNPYVSFSLSPVDAKHNKRIAVALNKGTAGEVFYFDLTGTGYVTNSVYAEHYTGFGEIAALSYRNR